MLKGLVPVVKSTLVAKEDEVIPLMLAVLRNIDTVLSIPLVNTRSGLPSPSRSPMTTFRGSLPVVKSTLAANEPAVIAPLLAVLR